MWQDGPMTTVFAPKDAFYIYAALAWVVVNYVLLPLLLPWSIRRWLNVPAMLMHEFAHWLVAYATFSFPRVDFREGVDRDGCPTVAHVRWHLSWFGWIGEAVICIAPFVAGLGLAYYIADQQFTQEQPFWHGIGWLALFCISIESANMISNSDFQGLRLPGKAVFLVFVFHIFLFGIGAMALWTIDQMIEGGLLRWLIENAVPWLETTIRALQDKMPQTNWI